MTTFICWRVEDDGSQDHATYSSVTSAEDAASNYVKSGYAKGSKLIVVAALDSAHRLYPGKGLKFFRPVTRPIVEAVLVP
jgi:hypothetical protein